MENKHTPSHHPHRLDYEPIANSAARSPTKAMTAATHRRLFRSLILGWAAIVPQIHIIAGRVGQSEMTDLDCPQSDLFTESNGRPLLDVGRDLRHS